MSNEEEDITIDGIKYEVINGELIIDRTTTPIPYDGAYLDNYTKLSASVFSIKLCQWRRAYAETWSNEGKDTPEPLFLDYGCGYSPIIGNIYMGNWNEDIGEWYGTDCNLGVSKLGHMSQKWVAPTEVNLEEYDVVCFFDVMEHLRNYKDILNKIAIGNAIVITVPCWADWSDMPSIVNWRHYKPGEHFLYGSAEGWIKEIESNGFELLNHTTFETAMGRQDSHTMAFRKVK